MSGLVITHAALVIGSYFVAVGIVIARFSGWLSFPLLRMHRPSACQHPHAAMLWIDKVLY